MTLTGIIVNLSIVLLPYGAEMGETGLYCGKQAGGAYTLVPATAYVCDYDENMEFYKWHEIGHHIWNTILTEDQKEQYKKAHAKDKKKGLKAFYRQYGVHLFEEDFCDNFATLMTKENTKPLVMKRRLLIKKFLNL